MSTPGGQYATDVTDAQWQRIELQIAMIHLLLKKPLIKSNFCRLVYSVYLCRIISVQRWLTFCQKGSLSIYIFCSLFLRYRLGTDSSLGGAQWPPDEV